MRRSSDVNKRRKLRFGQAVLLGVQLSIETESDRGRPIRWRAVLPDGRWCISDRRWAAVEEALFHLGV